MGSLTTLDSIKRILARASSARLVVRDEPERADILLGNSLLFEADQNDEQDKLYCFHAADRRTGK